MYNDYLVPICARCYVKLCESTIHSILTTGVVSTMISILQMKKGKLSAMQIG
jgi:hypothetical protein